MMLSPTSSQARTRLPNRRPSHTEALEVAGQAFTVGFDPGPGTPADLEGPRPGRAPASPIGAALDLLASLERERAN